MEAPKCSMCGNNHWSSEPHKWTDTDTAYIRAVKELKPKERVHKLAKKVEEIVKSVHNSTKEAKDSPKSVHNVKNEVDVCTQLREVSIRKLRANLSSELRDLPFKIVKSGKVIAIVSGG